MSEKTPKNKFKGLAVFEAVLILALSGELAWQVKLKDYVHKSDDAIPASASPQERVRAVVEKEETLYQLDGKKILMNDGTYGQIFWPVFADVPACPRSADSIVTRNGYSFYKENGKLASIAGVDVSDYQGDIDWKKVKAAGVDFAMVRIGYRAYGSGDIILDENYGKNLKEAAAAGLKVGAYFFSQAANVDEAVKEADAVLDAIEDYDISYPVVYDWELIYGDKARTDKVTVEELADCCIAFCERVRSAGYKPMIYQNKNTTMFKLDLPRLKDYDFWLAEYADSPTYYYDYQMWQYASDGYVPGIKGEVDMNISFKDYSKE